MGQRMRKAAVAIGLFFFAAAGWQSIRDWLAQPDLIQGISYAGAESGIPAPNQTLDLYRARWPLSSSPLAVMPVAESARGLGEETALSLARAGLSVAVVRYPDERRDGGDGGARNALAPAQSIGAALRLLTTRAAEFGLDPNRTFWLARGDAGLHIAALAEDPARFGLSAGDVAGVIAVSAELPARPVGYRDDDEAQPGVRLKEPHERWPYAAAIRSPKGRLPFLILSSAGDARDAVTRSRRYANALLAAGHREVTHIIVSRRTSKTILEWNDEGNELGRHLILSFAGVRRLRHELGEQLSIERRWRQAPPRSTAAFWRDASAIRTRPVDPRFRSSLKTLYQNREYEFLATPMRTYHALDLLDYLSTRPPDEVGRGNYLTITNLLGQQLVLSRAQLRKFRPKLVVGIDDERNLFQWSVSYTTHRETTWMEPEAPRPHFIRPLGAFLHLPDRPATDLFANTLTRFALHPGSFRWVEANPLAPLDDLNAPVRRTFLEGIACLECHAFRGVGPRSHHVDAWTGMPRPGWALPLESYSEQSRRQFLFNQPVAAKLIGVSPLEIDPRIARLIDAVVAAERSKLSPDG